MEAAMKKESRQRLGLKMGAVFAAGLLLFIAQFGGRPLSEILLFFTMPFEAWGIFVRDGLSVTWLGIAVLMVASLVVCIWSRRCPWISYVLIAAYWFWTWIFTALSF
jgi:hypothetical protein